MLPATNLMQLQKMKDYIDVFFIFEKQGGLALLAHVYKPSLFTTDWLSFGIMCILDWFYWHHSFWRLFILTATCGKNEYLNTEHSNKWFAVIEALAHSLNTHFIIASHGWIISQWPFSLTLAIYLWFVDKLFELAGNLILLWDAFDVFFIWFLLLQINLINLNHGLACLKANIEIALVPFTVRF